MSSLIIKNFQTDPLLGALKSQIQAVPTMNGTGLMEQPTIPALSLVEDPTLIADTDRGVYVEKIYSIKLRPSPILVNQNLNELMASYINTDQSYSDYYTKLKKPQNVVKVQSQNLNPGVSTYEVYTKYNYVSKRYDETSQFYREEQLPASYQRSITRENFTDPSKFPFSPVDQSPNLVVMPESKTSMSAFPYYNQIRVSNKLSNNFSNRISQIGLGNTFLREYLQTINKSMMVFQAEDQGSNQYYQYSLPTFDLAEFVSSGFSGLESDVFIPPEYKNNQEPTMSPFPVDLDSGLSLSEQLIEFYRTLFGGIVTTMAKDEEAQRTWLDILNNVECASEDYAYEIKKYRNMPVGSPIQTLISRATNDTTVINDTQVRYGQKYAYYCSGHYVIFGNSYRYQNPEVVDLGQGDPYISVEVKIIPSIILVPIPLFAQTTMVIQPPPIFPKVSFSTKSTSSREIYMYLSPTKGYKIDKFHPITNEDENQMEMMELNRRDSELHSEFRFETVDEGGLYEIFRMDTAPKDLKDFAQNKLNEIRMPYDSPNAVFTDHISPNKKYYYLFRKVNSHDLVSNPTSIYEVELLIDANESKISVEVYNIPEKIQSSKYKYFKNLFQIQPAIEHTIFDNLQPGIFDRNSFVGSLDYLGLGMASDSVWSKKFKFRLRSTTSGKMIDFNVTFKLTKDKTEEDF